MKALIEEVNEKLSFILSELESRKYEVEDSLADVQDKIDDKIEEAKGYKVDVDAAKKEIKKYEDAISSLEKDLSDLNARFSNKDLNAILETGNKEINNQILNKQKEIAKQREKIAEYTEKARAIKDLLISLKREKETKKSKLLYLKSTYDYYSKELTRIMNYASENPDDLEEKVKEIETTQTIENYEFKNEPIVDDKPIFDAIESIENAEETGENIFNFNASTDDNTEENNYTDEIVNDEEDVTPDINDASDDEENTSFSENNLDDSNASNEEEIVEDNIFNNGINIFANAFNNEDADNKTIAETSSELNAEDGYKEENYEPISDDQTSDVQSNYLNMDYKDESKEDSVISEEKSDDSSSGANLLNEFNLFSEDELEKEPIHEEDLYKENSDNITDLFNNDSKDSFDSFDFKALSDSIDREYESIFGNSEGIQLIDNDDNFKSSGTKEPVNNSEIFDFFGNTEPVENPSTVENTNVSSSVVTNNDNEIIDFFKNNSIDFNHFSLEEQTKLKNNFDLISYTKTLDILRKNNIRLEMIYGAADIFTMAHSELEAIINKLLIAGQNTLNISYVLNALPLIKSIDLADVIESFGTAIKDANITDLVIKAKHLNELSGGNN